MHKSLRVAASPAVRTPECGPSATASARVTPRLARPLALRRAGHSVAGRPRRGLRRDAAAVAGGALLAAVLACGGGTALTAAIAGASFLYLGMAVDALRRAWLAGTALAAVAALALVGSQPAVAALVGLSWGLVVLRWLRPLTPALRATLPAWCSFHAAAMTALMLL